MCFSRTRRGRLGALPLAALCLAWAFALVSPLGTATAQAQANASDAVIRFDSDRWTITAGEVLRYMGRDCLEGAAVLSDVEFGDGVIEVDVVVTGQRSYPGIVFRAREGGNYERLYVRPHRAGLYPDALQYTPAFNGIAGWQLYNGPGLTAATEFPTDEWVTLRLEVEGRQARVYVGGSGHPALAIEDLKHGVSVGSIGLLGPANGTACFADFRYQVRDAAGPPPVAPDAAPEPGVITDWQISRVLPAGLVNRAAYPRFFAIFAAGWEGATVEPSGLADIARHRTRSGAETDLVFARTIVRSDEKQDVELSFGYSDEADVFLNGRKVFSGNSSYQYRDPSALGIVGLHDRLNLTLEKGLNEIFFMVSETFGGWGLMARTDVELDAPVKDHSRLVKVWETPAQLLTPESVQYDDRREVLYVSSFDVNYASTPDATGFISRLGLDGEILELEWIGALDAPTGMGMLDDRLYVLERGYLTEIDPDAGAVVQRYPVPGADFLNDLTVADDGSIFMSDTRPSAHQESRIYRFRAGAVEIWLEGDEINRANGLFAHGKELLVGNTGDGSLKAVHLTTKQVRKVVTLGAGVVDGIRADGRGNYLVSHWEGQVYAVSPTGDVVEILDTLPQAQNNIADFEFVLGRDLLIIPTFLGNRVIAYRLEGSSRVDADARTR